MGTGYAIIGVQLPDGASMQRTNAVYSQMDAILSKEPGIKGYNGIAGFGKTAAALEHEKVAGLLHAAEAASDGIRKLDALMRRRFSGKAPAVVGFLTSAQLDLALNRPNVIHAALLAGPASETVLARCRRLERFRTGDPPPKAAEAAPDLAGEESERV